MEREQIIQELNWRIESAARLHIQHGLYNSPGFSQQIDSIGRLVREHKVDVRRELLPEVQMLYRRYFD